MMRVVAEHLTNKKSSQKTIVGTSTLNIDILRGWGIIG